MRKILLMFLVLSMLMTASTAFADDMGIKIIGGPEIEAETVSLDDFKVNDLVDIEGYGEIEFYDVWWGDSNNTSIQLWLFFDILNTQLVSHNFYNDFTDVVCTYDDVYQFGGWTRGVGRDLSGQIVPSGSEGKDVAPMYRDKVIVGVTLPQDVYKRANEQGKSLVLTFKMAENEVTYNYKPN